MADRDRLASPVTAPGAADRGSVAVRVAATGAALGVLVGAALVTLTVVAGPGPGLTGYVSEAGVADSGSAWTYRIGVFALATALLLLAAALHPRPLRPGPTPRRDHMARRDRTPCRDPTARRDHTARRDQALWRGEDRLRLVAVWRSGYGLRVAALLLVASGLATVLSGAVTCSAGCPLPPFERATVADLVHGGASIAATAAVVFAMIAVTLTPAAGHTLRRTAATATVLALPLAGAVGLSMLFVGRGSLVGVLERLLLAVAAGWGLATAATLARRHPH